MLESVVAGLLNRFLKTYVDNLNTSQLNIGIWSGDVRLKNLKLKKEALDKFRLPVDVKEGYLGDLTLSIPWNNLKGKPVKVLVENVYLLASPANPDAQYEPEEEERRAYAAKLERLESAELLTTKPSAGLSAEDEAKNESFMASLTNRIIDNLQLTVKNVHLRYEDDVSVPEHPFAIGITLGGFSAVSTDKFWQPTFIHNAGEGIHKIAKLDSLAVYFDSECESLAGFPAEEAIKKFNALIANAGSDAEKVNHQYVLAPVSGEGRLVMNHHITADTPKTDAELLFKELAFTIDEDQYKDALSLIDLMHFYTRKHQYRKYRPSLQLVESNRYRALWKFAQDSILHEVKEKHRRWTWDYFRERRDDRRLYVYTFKLNARGEITPDDKSKLDELERKLSYQDIRFYRSIARSELRKERVKARQTEEQKKLQQGPTGKGANGSSGGGWLGWIWGGSKTQAHADSEQPQDLLSDEQRKELYDAIDWDEKEAVTSGIDVPKDALKLRLKAKLDTGSFALRRDPHGRNTDMLKITFDRFSADVLQRPDNLEAEMSLGGMGVFDGTLENTLHKQIVRVKQADDKDKSGGYLVDPEARATETAQDAHASSDKLDRKGVGEEQPTDQDPFFYVKFENNPLDERADTGLTVRMRYMEIIYHKGYVEDIYRFFKPPASQLESVNALVDAASTTLEGIRKETRAGLEFALQQHKTVDLRVDMNAPIIIIPEDVTRPDCQHIVLDAGYISVNSELVDKDAVAEIRSKEHQQYNDADFERLESLVYDRYHIKLQSAQLLMANTLEDCMDALAEESSPQIHILERINIDFKAETCIVAKAPNLTRFRVLGDLPDLHIHFSDRKYKRLMRMIDVAIPKFDDDTSDAALAPQVKTPKTNDAKSVKTAQTFRQAPLYPDNDDALSLGDHTDTEGEDEESDHRPLERRSSLKDRDESEDTFYDPGEIVEGNSNFRQKTFEFNFTVSKLQASIYKSDSSQDKPDKLLADAILQSFDFAFALRPYDMQVDIKLGAFTIDDKMVEETSRFQQLLTSDIDHAEKHGTTDLVRIHYARVQPESPEFMTVHEGNNQSVDVELSTISLVVTRASILMLFDWIMTTFTSGPDAAPSTTAPPTEMPPAASDSAVKAEDVNERLEKLRVKVKLSEVRLVLNDDGSRLATLSLQAADVSVLLRGPFMRVAAQLGNLSVRDDFESENLQEYRQLLSIEGDNLADFSYEKYDISDATYPGYDSQVYLRTGSFRLTFVEAPLHRILRFLTKFARMKAVYDAATSAAAQQASDLQQQVNKMRYDILAKTPIIVLPRHGQSTDVIVANLGEMSLSNSFSEDGGCIVTHIEAGLRKIRLSSSSETGKADDELQMLKDADLIFDITTIERGSADHQAKDTDRPDSEIIGTLSDVRMNLTAHQYAFLMDLAKSVPRAFATSEDEATEDADLAMKASPSASPAQSSTPDAVQAVDQQQEHSETVDLFPELAKVAVDEQGHKIALYSKLEFAFRCGGIHLELFTPDAINKATLKANSLARFALNDVDVKYKMVSNGSSEAEVLLRSFTVHDTRPEKLTKFREIIPASKEKGYQLMVSYTVSGGSERSSVANVTVDTPSIIFSLDPLFALLDFAKFPFNNNGSGQAQVKDSAEEASGQVTQAANTADNTEQGTLAFRVNIVQSSVKLLADPQRHDSEAIVLSIRQIQMAQQGTFVLSVDHLGIFLCKMDRPEETIRILDDFDLNLSMDNRAEDGSQSTSIELDVQPLVLRLSNRDIVLVGGIVARAAELSSSGQGNPDTTGKAEQPQRPSSKRPAQSRSMQVSTSAASTGRRRSSSAKRTQAEVLLTKETLRAVFGGLRLVLISDLHELPVLDMKTPRFTARVEDWSADMRAGLTLTPVLNYYNLTNSRWEALMDPWEFSLQATRNAATQATALTLASKKRFEINVTHTFIELAMNTMTLWTQKGDEVLKTSRGSNAPFLMCNRTGHPIVIWAESEDKTAKPEPVRIADGEDLPWRLDDWRAMRESATSNLVHNSIGLILEETQWERVKHISVEREGEQTYRLKPRLDKVAHRVLCEIKLVNNVKVVTIRSTLKVQNLTLVPSEMVIVDANGKKASAVFKLAPGAEVSVPIEAAYHQRFKFRPDPGFNHAWCTDAYHWQDFVKRPARTITCRSLEKDASFRFQAFAEFDKDDPLIKNYPRMTLRLRAPVEIENLLPFDIRFRVYDKNREHNWSSFLRKGGTSPLHMAELSHLLLLSVEIQESPFKRSEFAIINTDNPDDLPIEHHTPVEDRNGLKLNLQLFYVRYPSSGGAFKVQIYSPYVLFNKTGLDFALKSKSPLSAPKNVAGLDVFSPGTHRSETAPFLFNHGSRDARNRVLLRIADSGWSEPLSFETIGTDVEVVIPSQSGTEEIHVGMSVTEGLGDYKIIKVITLYPRFVLKNTLSKPIRVRPGGATYTLTLEPQERQALHWLKRGSETFISMSYSPFGEWTSLFKLNEVGETHLRLQNEEGSEDLIRADVGISAAIVYITICTEERGYPILIENASDYSFTVAQLITPAPRARYQEKKYPLKAHDKLPYAWDDPMQEKKSILLVAAGQTREIRPTEIGAQVPYKFGAGTSQGTVSIDVLAEGHTQVVRITNYDEQLSLFKLQRRETSLSMTRTSSQSSGRDAEFEAKEEKSPVLFTFNLSLEGIGLSLINKQMVELLYATLRGIRLSYNDSADSQQVSFSIKWIQIDNQLFGTQYNLLLYPSTIPKDAKELEARPNLNVAVSLLKDKGHGVLYFKYANILLQQMTIEVDEDFLFSLLDFSKFRGVAGAENELDNRLTDEGDDLPEAPQSQASTEVFFETLWLQPIQLDLSFMRTETVNSESALFSGNRNAVAYFLNAVTMAIGNVNDAPIRLSALIFEDIRLSYSVLSQRIILHYQQEFISQLYRVIGSADFLGNPIGLFSNVSSGVADLFYEPTEGVVEFRDFGSGLARGAGSFVKKTLFGVTDSMTKFTGSIGKGLSAATLDKQFQSQRRQRQRRNKPRHALYGVAAGAGSFVTSVASGFEGLARLPIEGAESGGAGGFFKGFGKGLVGVATKPVVGMFDFASNVTEGIRNTTTVFDQKAIDAVRLPRLIPHDRVLRPYNEREALGQFWLKNLENGRYREEHYIAHLPISGEKEEDLMVLVTNSAIILARVTKSKVMWHVPLRDLQSITLEPNGISLVLREGARGPFLALPDQESRLWLFGHIERVVNSHNTQRRVE